MQTLPRLEDLLNNLSGLKDYYERLIESNEQTIAQLHLQNEALRSQLVHVDALLGVKGEQEKEEVINEPPNLIDNFKLCSKYEGLTLRGAIQQMLLEHSGENCHIRFICNELFGKILSATEYKIVYSRVNTCLGQGARIGYWLRVPGQTGYYCVSSQVKQVTIQKAYSKPNISTRKYAEGEINLRAEYEGMSVIEAITKVLQSRPNRNFTVAEIISKLIPGHYSRKVYQNIRMTIYKELSRGHQEGRFDRVDVGIYAYINAA